ncbi:hypothetical protein NDU88_002370 [Pleurodeles waltl]|uniref:Uncharacterized protein n=1 Tax=Pleurodeles waltl TaxID=8319 RepID=A0AAV7U9P7_PLEWA|nr:hypothetical protein NDU88_002370 [Pleurodeles waltl]
MSACTLESHSPQRPPRASPVRAALLRLSRCCRAHLSRSLLSTCSRSSGPRTTRRTRWRVHPTRAFFRMGLTAPGATPLSSASAGRPPPA